MQRLVVMALSLGSVLAFAQTPDECKQSAEQSPQVKLLEADGNQVTVHVLDAGDPDKGHQLLSAADAAGHAVGRLGACGDTALQVYIVVQRPLAAGVEQNETPEPEGAPGVFVPVPPLSGSVSTPPTSAGDLGCRGTYTECYGHPAGPLPGQTSRDEPGSKNVIRVPVPGGGGTAETQWLPLDEAIDGCFQKTFLHYTSPDWSRVDRNVLRSDAARVFGRAIPVLSFAVDNALTVDKLAYGELPPAFDPKYVPDYFVGWLTACLSREGALPAEDPRLAYAAYLGVPVSARGTDPAALRYDAFQKGHQTYPNHPWPWYLQRNRHPDQH